MPVVSTFFGLIIRMFFDDHDPPHFHVEYQGQMATFDFSGKLLTGKFALPWRSAWFENGRGFMNVNFRQTGKE